jgi:hypothetical protein
MGTQAVISLDRMALHFGQQKVNLHQRRHEFDHKAAHPTPGSADLRFITMDPLKAVIRHSDEPLLEVTIWSSSRSM